MKRVLIHSLLLALALSSLAASGIAAEQRIATISLRKVFDGYYKTIAADATLKERAGAFDEEKKSLVDQYKKLRGEYDLALEDANNQAISADEREKRKQAAEGKLVEVREMEQTIQQFDRQAVATLDEQERRVRSKLLEEIQSVIDTQAKSGSYTLVIDSGGLTRNGTPIILFSTDVADLTDPVLKELNRTAPPGVLDGNEESP